METTEECCLLVCSSSLAQPAFLYHHRATYLGNGTAHGGLDPSTSIKKMPHRLAHSHKEDCSPTSPTDLVKTEPGITSNPLLSMCLVYVRIPETQARFLVLGKQEEDGKRLEAKVLRKSQWWQFICSSNH